MLNLVFGWLWIAMGVLSGGILGLGFHKQGFMGGYGSWERRLARLGHIAFFGTGFLNLMLAFTWILIGDSLEMGAMTQEVINVLFLFGAIGIPTCCFVAMKWKRFRHAFVVPVLSLTIGSLLLCFELMSLLELGGMIGGAS